MHSMAYNLEGKSIAVKITKNISKGINNVCIFNQDPSEIILRQRKYNLLAISVALFSD